MNLVDFRLTSLRAAYQAVEREATIAGVDIVESEIVGMVPQAAWDNHMPNDLKLSNWTSDRIIEIGLAKHDIVLAVFLGNVSRYNISKSVS